MLADLRQWANLLLLAQGYGGLKTGQAPSDERLGEGKPAAAACHFRSDAGQAYLTGVHLRKLLSPAQWRAELIKYRTCWTYPSDACAAYSASTGRRDVRCRAGQMTKKC